MYGVGGGGGGGVCGGGEIGSKLNPSYLLTQPPPPAPPKGEGVSQHPSGRWPDGGHLVPHVLHASATNRAEASERYLRDLLGGSAQRKLA